MTVSVIIPHYGRGELLSACLSALWFNTDPFELIVVDNNEQNRGFAAGCNEGAKRSTGDLLVFLNNDTEVRAGWLPPLIETLSDPAVAIAGCKLLYPDGRVQHAGVDLYMVGDTLTASHANPALADSRRKVEAVTGACLAIWRDCFEEFCGFDEGFWNGYEDVDLCLKAGDRGWQVWYEPRSVVMHHESASGPERWRGVQQNVARLNDKWAWKWS